MSRRTKDVLDVPVRLPTVVAEWGMCGSVGTCRQESWFGDYDKSSGKKENIQTEVGKRMA